MEWYVMIELVYMSHANKPFSDDELLELLSRARKNNTKLGLTGMLLYNGEGVFIQVLEGPADEVHTLYNKIKQDPRHRDIQDLVSLPIVERSFPEWTMAFHRIANKDEIDGFSDFMETSKTQRISTHNNNFAVDMLNYFKANNQ